METLEKDYGTLIVDNGHIFDIDGDMSDNGFIYKDYEAFRSGWGICYIGEFGLEAMHEELANLEALYENQKPEDAGYMTDDEYEERRDEIIRSHGETRQTIIEQVRQAFGNDYMLTDEQVEYFASDIFQLADWACVATYLAENFNLDDLIQFDHDYIPEGRRLFNQFQYEAVMHDMFPKEYQESQGKA